MASATMEDEIMHTNISRRTMIAGGTAVLPLAIAAPAAAYVMPVEDSQST